MHAEQTNTMSLYGWLNKSSSKAKDLLLPEESDGILLLHQTRSFGGAEVRYHSCLQMLTII